MQERLVGLSQETTLGSEIQSLLDDMGSGKVDGVAYDTAWLARLAPRYPGCGFEVCLEWLRRNQHEDGTWGASLVHHHDRFISTLAAIVALREVGGSDSRDERRIKRGEDALWRLVGRLGRDDSDTVGFPVVSASLVEEAAALGLDVPRAPIRYLKTYQQKVRAFLALTRRDWRTSPLSFSLDGLRSSVEAGDSVLEENASVGTSPSATAAYLLSYEDPAALEYLRSTLDNTGAAPALDPIEVFEIIWSFYSLWRADLIQTDDSVVRHWLDYVWELWSNDKGTYFSKYFRVYDLDLTSASFAVLRWAGYPVSADAFAYFEQDDHFVTYIGETNPSPSTHLRLLCALKMCDDHPMQAAWIEKVVAALARFDENGAYWWDKWHVSPYYVSNLAVYALHNIEDDLARSRIKWIQRTQNDDGGWGYLSNSTQEETAYCLDALLYWHNHVEPVDADTLESGIQYMERRQSDRVYPPLWVGKSLFTPPIIVRSVILGARSKIESYSQDSSRSLIS